jgi:hypothetical protein
MQCRASFGVGGRAGATTSAGGRAGMSSDNASQNKEISRSIGQAIKVEL